MKAKLGIIALAVLGLMTMQASALITLSDYNSVVTVDEQSSAGMNSWTVDGVDHLNQQWFWYRVGSEGGENSVDTLGLVSADLNSSGNYLELVYGNQGLEITLRYSLQGGAPGSGAADIGEQIRVRNLTQDAMDFHFFQYSDFDLGGTIWDDQALIANANAVQQWDSGSALSETVVTPQPSHWQIGYFPSVVNLLNDGSPTTLSDATSPSGGGDLSWAFQWDVTIGAGGSFQISKDKQITPIPEVSSTMLLLGMALTTLGLVGRKFASR